MLWSSAGADWDGMGCAGMPRRHWEALGGHRSDTEMHWDKLGYSGVALRWLEHVRVTMDWEALEYSRMVLRLIEMHWSGSRMHWMELGYTGML